jgi:hypothetical protein
MHILSHLFLAVAVVQVFLTRLCFWTPNALRKVAVSLRFNLFPCGRYIEVLLLLPVVAALLELHLPMKLLVAPLQCSLLLLYNSCIQDLSVALIMKESSLPLSDTVSLALGPFLRNPRDAAFVRIVVVNLVSIVPLLLLCSWSSWVWVYIFLLRVVLADTAELLQHNNMHTRVFSPAVAAPVWARGCLQGIDWFSYLVSGPYYGYIGSFYDVLHLSIHHVEDAGEADWQQTISYDRTNFLDFCLFSTMFTGRSLCGVWVYRYLWQKKKWRAVRMLTASYAFWGALMYLSRLLETNFAVSFVLLTPVYFSTSSSIFAFRQHLFCSPLDLGNVLVNSLAEIPSSPMSFHSANHMVHHLHPSAHWSTWPELFERRVQEQLKSGDKEPPSVFKSGAPLLRAAFTRELDILLPYFLGSSSLPDSEVLRLLTERLQPRLMPQSSLVYSCFRLSRSPRGVTLAGTLARWWLALGRF